jgi:hypothetical protein
VPKIDLTESERLALAFIARRELETNRYVGAIQLEPLKTAFAKLAPTDPPPVMLPEALRPKFRRRWAPITLAVLVVLAVWTLVALALGLVK